MRLGMHDPLMCAAAGSERRDALSASALHFVTSTLNNRFIKIHGESSEAGLYPAPLGPHGTLTLFDIPHIPLASCTATSSAGRYDESSRIKNRARICSWNILWAGISMGVKGKGSREELCKIYDLLNSLKVDVSRRGTSGFNVSNLCISKDITFHDT